MNITEIEKTETQDEVIREIRKIKNDLAKLYDYNIRKMLDDARIRQKTGGRIILQPVKKKAAAV